MTMLRTERVLECLYCNRLGEQLYENIPDRRFGIEGTFGIKKCSACSLLWLDPRPIPEDIMKCYDYFEEATTTDEESCQRPFARFRDALRESILCGYFGDHSIHAQHHFCGLGKVLGLIPLMRKKAVYGYEGPFPRAPRVNCEALFIDVGCGRGDYLSWLRNLGWKVIGIEPHPDAADSAESKGIPVIRKGLLEARLPDECAQYISMIHVIEHFFDPSSAVRECWRMLKPGGKLIMRTPNILSLGHTVFKQHWFSLDPPRHLFLFSSQSLRRIFEEIPFRKVSLVSLAGGAASNYKSSMAVVRGERLPLRNIKKLKGTKWFCFQERLRLFIGQTAGEELELVAVK